VTGGRNNQLGLYSMKGLRFGTPEIKTAGAEVTAPALLLPAAANHITLLERLPGLPYLSAAPGVCRLPGLGKVAGRLGNYLLAASPTGSVRYQVSESFFRVSEQSLGICAPGLLLDRTAPVNVGGGVDFHFQLRTPVTAPYWRRA